MNRLTNERVGLLAIGALAGATLTLVALAWLVIRERDEGVDAQREQGWSDQETLHWLVGELAPASSALGESCGRLDRCGVAYAARDLEPGQVSDWPSHPNQIAACIQRRRQSCADATPPGEDAPQPEVARAWLDELRAKRASSLCTADARSDFIRHHPEVVGRLRRNSEVVPTHRGWETLEDWASDEGSREPLVVDTFLEHTDRCLDMLYQLPDGRPRPVSGHMDITRWLRERVYCLEAGGCCTLDRVVEMLERGIPLGPPDPGC